MSAVDLQAVISFLTLHCRPGGGNPLATLSAAQLVRDLPIRELALLHESLAGVELDSRLAALINERVADLGILQAA
jgi:hypothetical protein